MRTLEDLTSALIRALPTREELQALSDADIEQLRRFGNTYDNVLHIEAQRRSLEKRR